MLNISFSLIPRLRIAFRALAMFSIFLNGAEIFGKGGELMLATDPGLSLLARLRGADGEEERVSGRAKRRVLRGRSVADDHAHEHVAKIPGYARPGRGLTGRG